MSNKSTNVYSEALKQKKAEETNNTLVLTRHSTQPRDLSSDKAREDSREKLRETMREPKDGRLHPESLTIPNDLPTRDEIQEFSFWLRDELKVKVQAEVPYLWHEELTEIARSLNVGKLELYRYILGKFLGKLDKKT